MGKEVWEERVVRRERKGKIVRKGREGGSSEGGEGGDEDMLARLRPAMSLHRLKASWGRDDLGHQLKYPSARVTILLLFLFFFLRFLFPSYIFFFNSLLLTFHALSVFVVPTTCRPK